MSHKEQVFTPAHVADLIDASIGGLQRAGLALLRTDDVPYDGRHVVIEGRRLLNFGSCSYLGLELRSELRRATIEATERYGTQFSFSRVFIDSPLYIELESELSAITGGHALVTPTTTLGHIATLPALVQPGDAILVDQFTHASVQTAVNLLRDVPRETLRHNRLDQLEERLVALSPQHERIWYLFDGVYSMHGDLAPFDELVALHRRFPSLHLYVDDAHATSWAGQMGRGLALDAFAGQDRVVAALSLNKAFAASGGTLIFPSTAWRDRVRRSGGPMLFSGPIQPPMLGAALASAWLHRSGEFPSLQEGLAARIAAVLEGASGIPLHNLDRTPIFFVPCGADSTSYALAQALHAAGFYASASVFPAVARGRAGVRFTVSLHNTFEDIGALLETLTRLCRQLSIAPPPDPGQVTATDRPSGMRPAAIVAGADGEGQGTPSASGA